MDIGMLWFDNDKDADLASKIERAATYYKKKYGQTPNLCFVNPDMLHPEVSTPGVEVLGTKTMLPNHLWIGVR